MHSLSLAMWCSDPSQDSASQKTITKCSNMTLISRIINQNEPLFWSYPTPGILLSKQIKDSYRKSYESTWFLCYSTTSNMHVPSRVRL
jgi:hypothetical protein